MFIKVWCEYDFSGAFGGGNNEDVFEIPDNHDSDVVAASVASIVSRRTGLDVDELDGLFDWEYLEIESLF